LQLAGFLSLKLGSSVFRAKLKESIKGSNNLGLKHQGFTPSVAEFKEFERRFKFKPRFKYGWFHLKLYQMFQDLSRRSI